MSASNSAASTATNRDGPPAPQQLKGVVKQVLSGDTIVIRALKGNPPPEKQITFSYVSAPKLARRPGLAVDETKDENWAWESREYLRKKLIGQLVTFTYEKPANSNREYGYVWLNKGTDDEENIVESMVREGLVTVRRDSRQTPELHELIALEEQARNNGNGRWSNAERVRNIKWTQENPHNIVEHYRYEPVDAIIEHVRDGSTVRAFLLPDFHYITLMMAGIRCNGMKLDGDGKPDPGVKLKFADEARQYVESRLLQREVKIRLESTNNANFIGTIIYPKGNIAEALLREGYARCVDWSMAMMKEGAEKLRAAERIAKEKRLGLWEDYQSKAPVFSAKEKDFTGTVVEIVNGDAINVKLPNGQIKKVFFSSIRQPRAEGGDENSTKPPPRSKDSNSTTRYRPLYDVPYMFEAREFLRNKLINKKVQCTLDYISPAREIYPEKYCYTVSIGGQNVAEALVAKGLAKVVRHRQDDEQRSSAYDQLLVAEAQSAKNPPRKENATVRINDLTVDFPRIKTQYLPSWQRALRIDAIVEFVASGSRLRLYIPRDSCLVMFHLGGISCPRSSRPALNNMPAQEGEAYGDEALTFTRDRVLQRDVAVHIDSTDKNGSSVIGWLWTENNVNLSVALVEEGLAEVHFSAEKSEYYRQLKSAEDRAKAAKKNIWTNYVEQIVEEKPAEQQLNKSHDDDEIEEDQGTDNKEKLNVIVTEVKPELTFYAQTVENGPKLESLMAKLHADFQSNPPIAGAYTPRRDELCAAQFSVDKQWYRAKVERVQGQNATVLYIDYGNKEVVPFNRLASLPPAFTSEKPYAIEYEPALIELPSDNEDKEEALREFTDDVLNRQVQLHVELKQSGGPWLVTVHDPVTNNDIGRQLVADGLVLATKRRERKLKYLVEQYRAAQQAALAAHLAIWKYGDIRQDDAPEFSR